MSKIQMGWSPELEEGAEFFQTPPFKHQPAPVGWQATCRKCNPPGYNIWPFTKEPCAVHRP